MKGREEYPKVGGGIQILKGVSQIIGSNEKNVPGS
jgi:hypothetical protein